MHWSNKRRPGRRDRPSRGTPRAGAWGSDHRSAGGPQISAPIRISTRTRSLCGFFLRFMVVLLLLTALWPLLADAYTTFFCAGGNLLFGTFGSNGQVRFERSADPEDKPGESAVELYNRRSRVGVRVSGFNSLDLGYRPTAFLLALVVATPIPWARRRRAVLWALFWVNVYVGFRVLVFLLVNFSRSDPVALFTPGPFAAKLRTFAYLFVVLSYSWLVVPLPIWVFLCFGRSDWKALMANEHADSREMTT